MTSNNYHPKGQHNKEGEEKNPTTGKKETPEELEHVDGFIHPFREAAKIWFQLNEAIFLTNNNGMSCHCCVMVCYIFSNICDVSHTLVRQLQHKQYQECASPFFLHTVIVFSCVVVSLTNLVPTSLFFFSSNCYTGHRTNEWTTFLL